MPKGKYLLMLAASAALLPGCDKADHQAGTETAQANTAAEEQAIGAVNQRWLQLIRAKDAAAIAQLYAEDGVLMPPNEAAVRGREAIAEWWGRSMQMPGYNLSFSTDELLVASSGDMALDRGSYRFAAQGPDGPINDNGKYVVVWRKVGDEWKVLADIFNSDGAAAQSS